MTHEGRRKGESESLRREAEGRLAQSGEAPAAATPGADRLVHELQVHQIELEMQNEELRRTRSQLETLLAEYTDLYDFAPVGYLTLDRGRHIRKLNLTAAALLGAERSTLVSQPFDRFLDVGDRKAFSAFVARVFAGDAGAHCEGSLIRTDRDPVAVHIDGTLVESGDECRVVVQDTTARSRAEATLRLHSAALNAAANAIMVADGDGTIVWANAAFAQLTGYALDELVGRTPGDLFKSGEHDAAFYRSMWETITAGRVWRGELTNRRKDGSTYPEEMTITPVPGGGTGAMHYIAIKRDLTEERAERARAMQSLKMESIGRLAGGVAHDFNNLLTVIQNAAELTEAALPAGDPMREDLAEIRAAADRASTLTRQLLAFSRRQVLRPEVLCPNTVVAGMQYMLTRLIGADIAVALALAPDLGNVLADPAQIEQVLLNLAVNARDAMPDGGSLTITTANAQLDAAFASRHPSVVPGPHIALSVRDTGGGMDEATRRHVFEPFFTTKEVGKGTGLGLATVYGIIKQSGGSVWVDSEPGQGTTVTIYLPRQVDAVAEPAPTSAVALATGHETILLVEDEEALRRVAMRILQKAGYTVLPAANGVEALDLVEQHDGPVHLMLTDMIMPAMGGRELKNRITAAHPDIKVVLMSGYTQDETLQHGDDSTAFLGKPYTIADLTRKVRDVLDGTG